ncbi:hypothetical protein GIB67_013347 [Kingdonia uniflora]|uniref:Zinc finger PHD-type domain-containing protein n=1 Tax=Kingdonia uniflora TaxID=39325 RepID=A0A7J7LQR7_9MAGN|nr:hypothetical protein GIB67_013347 [Kingdonia uniflora]
MSYSDDDDAEIIVKFVTNYVLLDDNDDQISFSKLPVQWSNQTRDVVTKEPIYLHGTADSKIPFLEQVTAWKLQLSYDEPEISVLSKKRKWIKLGKPRKIFVDTMKEIFVSIHFLHYVKKNPETSRKSVWDHLKKVFRVHDVIPLENDLVKQILFITAAAKTDKFLAESEFMLSFIDNSKKRKAPDEDTHSGFNLRKPKLLCKASDGALKDNIRSEYDEKNDLADSMCTFCDNGGDVLCCDGRCYRSFHATVDDAADTNCKSLGLSKEELKVCQIFLCPNCKYEQHQCFGCGKLGSSDKSCDAEVFRCHSVGCGNFYHPKCVSKLLHPKNEAEAQQLQKKITIGKSFTCPVHKCLACKQEEKKDVPELQFALCRRCPKAYHRKCLPREIAFEGCTDKEMPARAWDGLLPNRILIYCLEHKIDKDLLTPTRDHVIFPKEENKNISKSIWKTRRVKVAKRSVPGEKPKQVHKASSAVEDNKSNLNSKKEVYEERFECPEVLREDDSPKMHLKDNLKYVSMEMDRSTTQGEQMLPLKGRDLNILPLLDEDTPLLDEKTKKRLVTLMDEQSSITLKEFVKNYSDLYRHAGSKNVEGTVEPRKLEASVEVLEKNIKFEDENVEDAKDVCEAKTLFEIANWKVVDKLHWYVQNGDMIVNFCCGANSFNCLMKQKLEESGKECYYKDYADIQLKLYDSDCDFPQGDLMNLDLKELLTGSKLIMGFNAPFGNEAAFASKLIRKALELKPKLLLLILATNTERLDVNAYNMIWEDSEKFSSKCLYLPEYINDIQLEQWNSKPPSMYLWSRPDWVVKHKVIALKQSHLAKERIDSKESPQPNLDYQLMDDFNDYTEISNQANGYPNEEGNEEIRGSIAESFGTFPENSLEGFSQSPSDESDEKSVYYRDLSGFVPGPLQPYFGQELCGCGWLDE